MFKNSRAIKKILLPLCALVISAFYVDAAAAQNPIKPPTAKPTTAAPPPPPPAAPPARAQAGEQEDESRQIFFDYAESRPKKSAASAKPKKSRRYVRRTPKAAVGVGAGVSKDAKPNDAKVPVRKGEELAQVGVTIWQLRPSGASDDKETRILDQEETDARVELTPVRIEAETLLKVRDKVRLSIESPRTGYLYVIDRELYADGSMSAPYLIFPTQRTRGGDNAVRAGVLIDIPAQDDSPNCFTLKPSRPDQVGEVLTVLVTTEPLDIPPLQRKYMRLDEAQVAEWERMWKTDAERFEMEGGAGQTWTQAEKAASGNESRVLDQEDPAPQTIYRVTTKPGNAVMITVPLRYAASAASSKDSGKQ
ncbi:MAG: hypothetical protein H7Y30_11135 [Pyrinomonadaceae bacterium]|nr:hypothetical protein [Pyrinomonadaceae bacterium]